MIFSGKGGMKLKATSGFVSVLAVSLLLSSTLFCFSITPCQLVFSFASSESSFTSIQKAINEAENGSTVLVPSGIYFERIVVNKTISLVGGNVSTTIIDGSNAGTVVEVTADNVSIVGFTIRNSGWGWTKNGILVHFADNCEIRGNRFITNCHNIRLNYSCNSQVMDNLIDGNGYGIRLLHAVDCVAIGNNISHCIGGIHLEFARNCTVKRNICIRNDQGIRMYSPCTYNTITANTVINNTYDGMIDNSMNGNATFYDNRIFHNNFINNTYPFICKGYGNIWHDGYPSGGNYWSRYNGTDLQQGPYQNETGSDGIGDTPYAMNSNNIDKYPLMQRWKALPVCNINTSKSYASIQEAIDAPETLNGHTLHIESGVYRQNVNVHKTLKIIGEDKLTTSIDGNNIGTVLSVNANNVSISGFTIRNSGLNSPPYGMDCGIILNHSIGCTISQCLVTNNRVGIYVFFSRFNLIEHNTVYANHKDGIWLWFSGNNVLKENKISNNEYNFGVFGGEFSDFNNVIDTSNQVDGKTIQYLIGAKDKTFNDTITGVLYLINCVNVTVQNLSLKKNGHGVFCFNLTDSRIENVTGLDNNYGIYLQDSDNNIVASSHCINDWVGISLQGSSHNAIEASFAQKCEKGILLYEADNNTLTSNTLLDNFYGIRMFSSDYNTIFHNNLLKSTKQIDLISSYENIWDNGCEGNYWSDYNGTDIDRDGVGDTYLPWQGIDGYPLINAYLIGDINHDGAVSILDVVKVCAGYMATPLSAYWNPHADVSEPYEIIDMLDILVVTTHYGSKWKQP